MRKQRVVGRIFGMKYSWKGHKDRNRRKNRIRSGQARFAYIENINHNIPTTCHTFCAMLAWKDADFEAPCAENTELSNILSDQACQNCSQGPPSEKDWKRISAESSLMFRRRSNRSRDWTELNWTALPFARDSPILIHFRQFIQLHFTLISLSHKVSWLVGALSPVNPAIKWVSWCFEPSQPSYKVTWECVFLAQSTQP